MSDETDQAQFIAIASPKGGAGKTMTTILLAAEFAAAGQNVLILDTDIQGSAIGWFTTSKRSKFTLKNINVEHIHEKKDVAARFKALSINSEGYDIVLVDVQGTAEAVVASAVLYCDLIIIPAKMHKFDVDQAVEFAQFIENSSGRGKPKPYRILLNAINAIERNAPSYKAADMILQKSNANIFKTTLSFRPTYATAATAGSLYEVSNPNKTIQEARNATRMLLNEVISTLNMIAEDAA